MNMTRMIQSFPLLLLAALSASAWAEQQCAIQGDDSCVAATTSTATNNSKAFRHDDENRRSTSSSGMIVTVQLHRNGEPDACGSAPLSLSLLKQELEAMNSLNDKYQVESTLTEFFQAPLLENKGNDDGNRTEGLCASTERKRNFNLKGFAGFCDMGPGRTVPQPDSHHLVPLAETGSLPCRFYTREGVRISSWQQLSDLASNNNNATDGDLHLYAVPAGRVLMFAPKFVGEVFELTHVRDQKGNSLALKVLSTSPRVFDIINFFSEQEAQQLMDKAVRETSETHKLHRSTTGTIGASIYDRRTSENAWDTHGVTAQIIKKRCMKTLGFDEYYESHTDGLQILRYNQTNAYTTHMDYLSDVPKELYDYRSGGRGGNRFATILLYMSDLEEGWGGETVFPGGARIGNDHLPTNKQEMIRYLRDNGQIDMLEPGSWEEDMTATCRTSLTVIPKKSRAVLFYSQFPNGMQDLASNHGACPVLRGQKWAANLWVWNAARKEFDFAPSKLEHEQNNNKQPKVSPNNAVSAVFHNSGKDPKMSHAQLYWQDQFFGDLAPGESIRIDTYVSHVWQIKDANNGSVLHTWTINHASTEEQYFSI